MFNIIDCKIINDASHDRFVNDTDEDMDKKEILT